MAKRHQIGIGVADRIRRAQELIMAHSGVDEFYEVIRLIVAKKLAELDGKKGLPSIDHCNRLLRSVGKDLDFMLGGLIELETPVAIYADIQQIFSGLVISDQGAHTLDQVFEELTSRHYKSDKGQYFTPRHVIDMCVEAIAPQPDEIICDPACGSGAFLSSAYAHQMQNYGEPGGLIGFDYSKRACQVAKLVSWLSTGSSIEIFQLDALELGQKKGNAESIEATMGGQFAGFDAILTNPPFAGDVSGEVYAKSYEVAPLFANRLERDVLFIERCIKLLKVGGRLAIVVPDNKVSGRAFASLREWLAKTAELRAVVSLHRHTFLPHTSQKTAVIFAIKREPSHDVYECDVDLIRSERPGKSSNGSPNLKAGFLPSDKPFEAYDHDLDEVAVAVRNALCR